jgi:leader peptidase (prepilin peptidase)/N-methyltransferase
MSFFGLFEGITDWPWAEGAATLAGFAWGAMFGSFINVIAHRMPRGASVVSSPSCCPRCGAAIRPWDNVPVLAWLWLGGRCRDCRASIPATYPLVEAGCGSLVMLLAVTELSTPGAIDRLLRGDLRGLASWGLQAARVLTVVAWSRLDAAGWRPRTGVWLVPVLVAAVGAIAAVPQAGPRLAWEGTPRWLAAGTPANAAVAAVAGVVAGGLAGQGVAVILGPAGRGQALAWGLPLAGSLLGWQGAAISAALTLAGARIGRLGPGAAGLFLAACTTLALSGRAKFWGLLAQLVSGS